jgi:hypothetical protein
MCAKQKYLQIICATFAKCVCRKKRASSALCNVKTPLRFVGYMWFVHIMRSAIAKQRSFVEKTTRLLFLSMLKIEGHHESIRYAQTRTPALNSLATYYKVVLLLIDTVKFDEILPYLFYNANGLRNSQEN